jgi:hypothetical protein
MKRWFYRGCLGSRIFANCLARQRRNQKSYPQMNTDYRRLEIRSFLICVYLRKSADEKQLRENVVRKTRKRRIVVRMTQSSVRQNCRSHLSLPPFVEPNSPAARFVQYVIRQSFGISKAAREGLRRGFTEASSHPLAVWLRLRCLGWWARRDLNPRPRDYESPALTD